MGILQGEKECDGRSLQSSNIGLRGQNSSRAGHIIVC